jgi:DNA-binding PadR family transcriptional regulator
MRKISSYSSPVRRKEGVLLPIEVSILDAGLRARGHGAEEFHGFQLAQEIGERDGARMLTAHGTLYKALGRLVTAGLLESRWEDPNIGAAEGRPRRRLYRVTLAGARALAEAASTADAPAGAPVGRRAALVGEGAR